MRCSISFRLNGEIPRLLLLILLQCTDEQLHDVRASSATDQFVKCLFFIVPDCQKYFQYFIWLLKCNISTARQLKARSRKGLVNLVVKTYHLSEQYIFLFIISNCLSLGFKVELTYFPQTMRFWMQGRVCQIHLIAGFMFPCCGVAFILQISFRDEIRQDVGLLPSDIISESKGQVLGALQEILSR